MKMMKRISQTMCVLICLAAGAAAELSITGIDGASLSWTNSVSNATYEVLTAPTLTSSWDEVSVVTNLLSISLAPSTSPGFYRVRWLDTPGVVSTNLNAYITWNDRTYVDLNGDGQTDVTLWEETLSPLNGFEMVQTIYVLAHGVCGTPFALGTPIRMNLSPHSWQPAPQYGGVAIAQRHNAIEGPWEGPWSGVTNAFLPVQFLVTGAIHLGWLQLSPSTNMNAWGIQSGAYRPAPETMLNAGE